MGLFKTKDETPPAGATPPSDPNGTPPEPKYVTEEQFNSIKGQLDSVAQSLERFQTAAEAHPPYQQTSTPAAPAADPHEGTKARIAAIDNELKELAEKAESAGYSGKGLGEVMTRQNQLFTERGELQGQMLASRVDPRMEAGIYTLDALSTEITSSKMPYLSVPEVKDRYSHYIGQLSPEQRMNPQAKIGAYNLAVGENQTKIEEIKRQQWLREAEEAATQDPASGGSSGRSAGAGTPGIPRPEDVLSPQALKTIKGSRQHEPDSYYRSLGYGGWEDYYTKNKDYFEQEEE